MERNISLVGEKASRYPTNSITPLADQGEGGLDSTLSVYSYSKLYYDVTTLRGVSHYKLTKLTGYWTLQEGGLGISNTKVRLNLAGPSDAGCDGLCTQSSDHSVSTSFTVNGKSSWIPVIKSKYNVLSAYMTATISEGSSKWNVKYTHNLFNKLN